MLTFQQSITRLQENEDRLDDFVNQLGTYTTRLGVPVETIRSFLARKDLEVDEAFAANVILALTATSTTSNTVGAGTKTFTIQPNKGFVPGQFVVITSQANPLSYMLCRITSYDKITGVLVVSVTDFGGATGPFTDWLISLSAPVANIAQVVQGLRAYLEGDVELPLTQAGILSDGSFPTDAREELGVVFSGQDPIGALPRIAPVLAQTIFQPAQELMTEFVHFRTDLVPGSTIYRAIPLVALKSFSFNSPLDMKLFSAVRIQDGAITEFRCNSDYPIHTVLQGTMSILVRVGTVNTPRFNLRMALRPVDNLPEIELGNAAGRQELGIALSSLDATPVALTTNELKDPTVGGLSAIDGLWVRKIINVCQDVVFYPGASYNLTLRVVDLNLSVPVDQKNYGFRYESGGLSMMFDATMAWKNVAINNVNL